MKIQIEPDDSLLRNAVQAQVGSALAAMTREHIEAEAINRMARPGDVANLVMQRDALRKESEELRTGWLTLQCDIAALIPPIDGERGNDPIINRVKRVVVELFNHKEDKRIESMLPGMSPMNRTIAYSAAAKLRELGYKWDGLNWIAAPAASPWTHVSDGLPASGRVVLACYTNSAGNLRRIRANWIAAKTVESGGDSDIGVYDEATDTHYDPEGWYERIDNWPDYSAVAVIEGEVTHWMPLPEGPLP